MIVVRTGWRILYEYSYNTFFTSSQRVEMFKLGEIIYKGEHAVHQLFATCVIWITIDGASFDVLGVYVVPPPPPNAM